MIWGGDTEKGVNKSTQAACMCASTCIHMCVVHDLAQGGEARSPSHVPWAQPQNMQIPLKLLSQKPKQYYFVLHTLKAQMVQAGDEKKRGQFSSICRDQSSVKKFISTLHMASKETIHIKRSLTQQLHKLPTVNILNYMAKVVQDTLLVRDNRYISRESSWTYRNNHVT